MIAEFPARQWKRHTLFDLVQRTDSTGSTARLASRRRRHSVRTDSNVKLVNDLICSQEGQPGTSKSPREIARESVISRFSVARIANKDLQLSVFRRCKVQSLSA